MPSQLFIGPRLTMRATINAIAILGGLLLTAAPAAAQWRVTPSVSVGLNYDDNFFLNASSILIESVSGIALEGDAKFSRDSQLAKFSITPRLRLNRYDDHSDLNSESAFIDFDYLYTGQLSRFQFFGSYSDETIRTAERSEIDFETDDPDDIPVDDSGRVSAIDNRQRLRLTPRWSYRPSQKSTIRIRAGYQDVRYDDSLVNTLRDYSETRLQPSFEYELSARNTVGLSGYYRQTDFDQADGGRTGYGLTFNYNRSLDEKTRLKFGIGVDSTEDSNSVDQRNPIGEISITRVLQTSRILASYQRSIQGSGAAVLSVRDSISLNLTRDLSERFSIGAGLRAYKTSALDDNVVSFDEREYVQVGGLFTWNLTRAVAVDFDYRHTYIDREILTSDASSNQVNLWIRYEPTL